MTAPRLEIRNIVKSFGGRQVVDDVSLTVQAGQVTCLLGPLGLRQIDHPADHRRRRDAGQQARSMPTANWSATPITRVPPEGRSIGLMFQDFRAVSRI